MSYTDLESLAVYNISKLADTITQSFLDLYVYYISMYHACFTNHEGLV